MKDFVGNELHVGDEIVYYDKTLRRGKITRLETSKYKKDYVFIYNTKKMARCVVKVNTNAIKGE